MRRGFRSVLFLLLMLPSQEAFVSGAQYMQGVSGFVYVSVAVALKIPGHTPDMQAAAYDANRERMSQGSKQAMAIAQKVEARLKDLKKTVDDHGVEFVPIDKKYKNISKDSSDSEAVPTYSDDDPWQTIHSDPYYLVHEYPLVVVRFKRWPGPKIRAEIKKTVEEVLSQFEPL